MLLEGTQVGEFRIGADSLQEGVRCLAKPSRIDTRELLSESTSVVVSHLVDPSTEEMEVLFAPWYLTGLI